MPNLRIAIISVAIASAVLNAGAQNVITDWNTIAATTIVTNAGEPIAASGVWFAYTSIAVYDAVNAVHQQKFQPFYYSGSARSEASEEAAAAAAAHGVLVHYFPNQQANLDALLDQSLSNIAA